MIKGRKEIQFIQHRIKKIVISIQNQMKKLGKTHQLIMRILNIQFPSKNNSPMKNSSF